MSSVLPQLTASSCNYLPQAYIAIPTHVLFIHTCRYIVYYLFVILCVCTVTDFSAMDKASGDKPLHGGSSASMAGNLPFLWTLLLQKPKIGQIGQRVGHTHRDVNITIEMCRRKRHARAVPFVKLHSVWT